MSQPAIDAKLEAEFAAVAASSGCELVHVDYRQGKLQVLLDRPQGVTLGDCQAVSKQLSALLDVSEFGGESYLLEVSSPGLDRPLFGARDYERFCGQLVRVTYFSGEPRTQKTIVGRLECSDSAAGNEGQIFVIDPKTDQRAEIPLHDIKKARLEPDL